MRTPFLLICLVLTFVLFPSVVRSQEVDKNKKPFEPKWVTSVVFEGNKKFSDKELLGLFEKEENVGGLVNTLFVYRHDRRYLEYRIVDELRNFYRSHGYLDTKVLPLKFAVEGEDVRIVVPIEEGRVYRFGQVHISELDDKSKEEEILNILHLETGEIANVSVLQQRIGEIRHFFANRGYATCDLEFEPTINPPADSDSSGDGTLDLDLYVVLGPIFRFGEVTNFGKALSPAINNLVTFQKGEIFDQSKLDETIKRLNESDLFKEINPDSDVEINKTSRTENAVSDQVAKTEAVINLASEFPPVLVKSENGGLQPTGVASIDMKIEEQGPPKFYFLESVRFIGNKSISDDELKQSLGLDYTGLFDSKLFLQWLKEFNQSGRLRPIVDDDIEIEIGEPGKGDDEIRTDLHLTIRVRELVKRPNPNKPPKPCPSSSAPSPGPPGVSAA